MNLRDYLTREDKSLASALPKGKPGCKFPGCQLPHRARGYCDSHYTQLMRGQKLRKIHPKQGAGNRFAKQIGVVPTTVYMYAAGERYPQPDIMAKIVKVTDGEVGPIDFLRQRKPRPARKKRPSAPRIPCSVENCKTKAYAKGFCHPHYRRQLAGKPMVPIVRRKKRAAGGRG